MIENGLRIEWPAARRNGTAWAELCAGEAGVTGHAERKRIANLRHGRLPACATSSATESPDSESGQSKAMLGGTGCLNSIGRPAPFAFYRLLPPFTAFRLGRGANGIRKTNQKPGRKRGERTLCNGLYRFLTGFNGLRRKKLFSGRRIHFLAMNLHRDGRKKPPLPSPLPQRRRGRRIGLRPVQGATRYRVGSWESGFDAGGALNCARGRVRSPNQGSGSPSLAFARIAMGGRFGGFNRRWLPAIRRLRL